MLHQQRMEQLIHNQGEENPYKLHQELGDWMTRCVTVVRNNKDLQACLDKIDEFADRYQRAALSDKGHWTNQNFSFTRALGDMILLARVISKGALMRDECRGAHYKPAFEISPTNADDPVKLREQAEKWCRAFKEQSDRWLKTTIAKHTPNGPEITYEEVDTSLIPPRPRTYGLKGAEIIEKTWKEMSARASRSKEAAAMTTMVGSGKS
jgi:succinate dehydrogenase / fumarate reductase flavoprotein subunit